MIGYYSVAIVVVIVLILVYVLYTVFFKTKTDINDMLTGVRSSDTSYTVSKDIIYKKNNKLPVANYAISIWYYLSSWVATEQNKNILEVPNLLEMTLGSRSNNLYVKMFGSDTQTEVPPSPTSINLEGLVKDTVYKYGNTYIFVYTKTNEQKPWKSVRVAFSINNQTSSVTEATLANGRDVNSFLLEEKPLTGGSSVPSNINVPITNCLTLAWSCTPVTGNCPTTSSGSQSCVPDIERNFDTYPFNEELRAAVYTLRNTSGDAYFAANQKFTFLYYPDVATGTNAATILSTPTVLAEYKSAFTTDYNLYESIPPSIQYSNSVLIPTDVSLYENIMEPFVTEVSTMNIPLQTWTHVILNVIGKNLTIYINGQISSAYVLPFIPYQMNESIILTRAPSFVGFTSGLQYITEGVSAGEVRQIYNSGHLGKATIANSLSFFNRYSLKLIFVDNNDKLLK